MIRKYTPEQWSKINDYETEPDEIAFYADMDSAIAGSRHQDGTYEVFGAGIEVANLTYQEMIDYIKTGY